MSAPIRTSQSVAVACEHNSKKRVRIEQNHHGISLNICTNGRDWDRCQIDEELMGLVTTCIGRFQVLSKTNMLLKKDMQVDDVVLVRNVESDRWEIRHFKEFSFDHKIVCWLRDKTSETTRNHSACQTWNFWERYLEDDDE